jgi:hypothetical protein
MIGRVLAIGALVTALVLMTRAACPRVCDDEFYQSVRSPDGIHEARIGIRGCGATTQDVTVLQVGVGSEYEDAVVVPGEGMVDYEWTSDGGTLVVRIPRATASIEPIRRIRGVNIRIE